jgi:hypothetical protein
LDWYLQNGPGRELGLSDLIDAAGDHTSLKLRLIAIEKADISFDVALFISRLIVVLC